jgi:hypothetical protein
VDIEYIRQKTTGVEIAAKILKTALYDLVDEMAIGFLEHFVVPISSSTSGLAVATTLCPHREIQNSGLFRLSLFHRYNLETNPCLDNASVESRALQASM